MQPAIYCTFTALVRNPFKINGSEYGNRTCLTAWDSRKGEGRFSTDGSRGKITNSGAPFQMQVTTK